jgi:hypothetical protein
LTIWRSAAYLAAVALVCIACGCTTLSPASVDDFGAEKTLLITLRDGQTIKGNIDEGETVIFTTFGRVYRADIESLSDNGDIVLVNLFIQEEYEKYAVQRERMESSKLRIEDDTQSISIPAYQIVQVEEIAMDKARSAWSAGFWGFTVFVAAMIMSTRL